MLANTFTAEDVLQRAYPVMPVMVIETIEQALPMARALYDGGISVFEITLRTECGTVTGRAPGWC